MRLRVALRWLQAKQNVQYDMMLRLQVLEGAAGVPPRTWWEKGPRGLAMAKAHFEEKGETGINPSWFVPQDSRAFEVLEAQLKGVAKGVVQPLDVIHSALFGIPLDPSVTKQNKIKLYEVGVKLKQGILSGEETPKKAIAGMGGKYIRQLVIAEIKAMSRHRALEQQDDEGEDINPLDNMSGPPIDAESVWGYLAKWWLTEGDPVGNALRTLMRKSWSGMKQEPGLNLWLDKSVEKGTLPTPAETAALLDIQLPEWTSNYLKPGMAKFVGLLKNQPNLLGAIEKRLIAAGFGDVDLDFNIPDPEDINPKRLPGGTRAQPKIHLTASASLFDQMIRLQVLEGFFGAKSGSWWKNPKAGLKEARRSLRGV